MTPSERLRVAGEAAEILEGMGYTSCARLRDGVVTLECWTHVGGQQHQMRYRVEESPASARVLAEACAGALRQAMARGQA